MKRGQQWFRNMLQCMILITGLYILYRGGGILAESGWLGELFGRDKTAQAMKELAVSAYLPEYQAALDEENHSLVGGWLRELAPLLWQEYRRMQEEAESGGDARGQAEETQEKEGQTEEPRTEGAREEERQTEEAQTEGAQTEGAREKESQTEEAQTEGAQEKEGQTEEAQTEETQGEERQTEEAQTEEAREEESQTEGPQTEAQSEGDQTREASAIPLENLGDFDYLLNHYFAVDPDTLADDSQLDAIAFLDTDLSIEKNPDVPQILIYHTHSQETFLDSVEGDESTSIVGIGDYLASILEEKYGYQVIHDRGVYDLVDGVLDRSAAYDYARASVEKILEQNPTIQVVIDLHRDGVDGVHFVTDVNGKQTAQIMFLNGLSRDSQGQAVSYLPNPYIQENLAFSFQLQLAAQQSYPGFTRNIYLKGQRYNLHLRPRSLLIEAGSQLNTVEEEKNAMEPLADILNQVLSGKNG